MLDKVWCGTNQDNGRDYAGLDSQTLYPAGVELRCGLDRGRKGKGALRRRSMVLLIEFTEQKSMSSLLVLRTAMPNLMNLISDFSETTDSTLPGLGSDSKPNKDVGSVTESLVVLPARHTNPTELISLQSYPSNHNCALYLWKSYSTFSRPTSRQALCKIRSLQV